MVTIKTTANHTVIINSDVTGKCALGFNKGVAGNVNGLTAVRLLGTDVFGGHLCLGPVNYPARTSTVTDAGGNIILDRSAPGTSTARRTPARHAARTAEPIPGL